MKRKFLIMLLVFSLALPTLAFAQTETYSYNPYAYKTYKTVAGDTLYAIATKYGVTTDDLISFNPHVSNTTTIQPDTTFFIPDIARSLYLQQRVITLINAERAKVGLKALAYSAPLGRVARYKSQDMAGTPYFSHTSPRYGSAAKMVSSFGLKWRMTGENIASGYTTPEGVVAGWMKSEGHKRNILSSRYNIIGVGIAKSYKNGKFYWTQEFIQTW